MIKKVIVYVHEEGPGKYVYVFARPVSKREAMLVAYGLMFEDYWCPDTEYEIQFEEVER